MNPYRRAARTLRERGRRLRRRGESVLRGLRSPLAPLAAPLLFAPALLGLVALPAGDASPAPAPEEVRPSRSAADVQMESMRERMRRIEAGLGGVEGYYEERIRPIERVLLRFNRNEDLVRRIAVALVREGEDVGIDARVLLPVLLVENPWLDPDARSFMGAVGLMQVMPFHAGNWDCPGDDLTDLDTNICYGTRIFARYLEGTGGDLDRALLRYNGCVNGTNTPNCHVYPTHVYARAGQAMVQGLLAARAD